MYDGKDHKNINTTTKGSGDEGSEIEVTNLNEESDKKKPIRDLHSHERVVTRGERLRSFHG